MVQHAPKETLRLRPAGFGDAHAIAELFLASRRDALPYLPKRHTDAETHAFIANVMMATCIVWVAEEEGRIVGFIAVNGHHVDHLYLQPGYYRRGIGTLLLEQAKMLSPRRLTLYAFQRNTRARAFYEHHGFIAAEFGDGTDNEEGEPDILYEWRGR